MSLNNQQKQLKKRGRKPKGGKILLNDNNNNTNTNNSNNSVKLKNNVILHLICNKKDLDKNNISANIEPFQFNNIINNNKNFINDYSNKSKNIDNKNLFSKLNELALKLHTNNITENNSACFWCTYTFDNPPIYIPESIINGVINCYGCFCTPECAVGYLFKEQIDSSTKFERYYLINYIYSKIYNYKKNIKPSPSPYYLLDKYNGSLSINEYRKLLTLDRLILIVDKPLTRHFPELHEDNNDLNININNNNNNFNINYNKTNKNDILTKNFNI